MANESTDSKMESGNPSIRIVCSDGSDPSYAMNEAPHNNELCIKEQAIEHQTSVLHDTEPTKQTYQASSPSLDIEASLEDRASRLVHSELFRTEIENQSTDSKMDSANPSSCVVCSDGSEPSYAMNSAS